MRTVLVSGAVANKHGHGGSIWVRMSWAESLRALGYDVVFVEQLDDAHAVDESGRVTPWRESVNAATFVAVMESFGFSGSSALLRPGSAETIGLSREELLAIASRADLLVDISGHLRDAELRALPAARAFVDLDPGYTQIWLAEGRDVGAGDHELHFTVGANVGTPASNLPTGGVRWRPIRQPVVLDRWPVSTDGFSRFTTIASWRGAFGPVAWGGRSYGVKAHEFRLLTDVPRAAGLPFEMVLDLHPADQRDADRLRAGGWSLGEPATVAAVEAFADYVRGSGAEFSAAQGVYVGTRSGWFSDRTVRYLASGRPALVQDTGQAESLPVGEGLLTFATPAEAVTRARELVADHETHSRAARRLAEDWFAPAPALAPLLDAAGILA